MKELLTERPNLFEPNVYITLVAELAGNLCPKKLVTAIQSAYEANEATMSKIVLDHGLAYYERLYTTNCTIEITDQPWTELIKQNEKKPFRLENGELVRTFLLMSKEKTEIMIMAHHLAGDGNSMLYLLKDCMCALSNTPLTYKPMTLLTKASFQQTRLPVLSRWYVRYCQYKWDERYVTWQEYDALHHKYWQSVSSDIRYNILSTIETQTILEQAKRIGCSVNSYLVTEFLKQYQNKCEVGIPVSIREKKNEAMSNLTSAISIKYQYDTRKSFEKNAKKVHKKITKTIQRHQLFALHFLSELPMTLIDTVSLCTHHLQCNRLAQHTASLMGYTGKKKRDLGVSNLTVIDIPTTYGSYQINNILFVPPAISYSHNVIGISTMNGRMTITYHAMKKQ